MNVEQQLQQRESTKIMVHPNSMCGTERKQSRRITYVYIYIYETP